MLFIWGNLNQSKWPVALLLGVAFASSELRATSIYVHLSKDQPLEGAQVVIVNEKTQQSRIFYTNRKGITEVEIPEDVAVTILCAHQDYLGWVRAGLRPKQKLSIKLKPRRGLGSLVTASDKSQLPGLEGEFKASFTPKGKLEITSENLFLGEQEDDKLTWKLKKPLAVSDHKKNEVEFSIKCIAGGKALVEYKKEIPIIPPEVAKRDVSITVLNAREKPIADATVLFIHSKNHTVIKGVTDFTGKAHLEGFPNAPMVVFCAHEHYRAYRSIVEYPYGEHQIILHQGDGVGSSAFHRRTGYLPGFKGRLNPILDNLGRYYIYATNIALNGGERQPVKFRLERPIYAVDATGKQCIIKILDIRGDASLLEFQFQ